MPYSSVKSIESEADPVFSIINAELARQQNQIELIASENFTSINVLRAMGSVMTNKYAEGYPNKRYYGGCTFVDQVEELAIERACALFDCAFANVQPHSGAQANTAVLYAFAKPGDTILGMNLSAGGHLTHGAAPTVSGKWFSSVVYGVRADDGRIDYEEVERLAHQHKPRIIIAGASAYPRQIDFARFRHISDAVGAILMADIAHYAGLVLAGLYDSPFPHAHVVTSTTHKTLRGPRGGLILWNDASYTRTINSAVFPGIQGGPLMHIIAAKAVAFYEALQPSFKDYARQVIKNAKALGGVLIEEGLALSSGGTDCHMLIVDLRPVGVTGSEAEQSLERAGITCNKNAIPFDPLPPAVTSGIRLGTPAGTTRGFQEKEYKEIGHLIAEVLRGIRHNGAENNQNVEKSVRQRITTLCDQYPLYPEGAALQGCLS
ncbi:MAG: serine hydroxymethyltransferase [Holosporales bacterium]|jgi:glycine hydroxymethyltransferase|nr:serine hydroxymethyltransferase [Holosporales bacterium]